MLKRLSGELSGTFFLVFCGTGAVILNQESGGAFGHAAVAAVFGGVVMLMILLFGRVSGAHINPAVTIGLTVSKRFNRKHVIPYLLAQLTGACLASLILRFIFPANSTLGATLPSGSESQSFFLEFLLGFLLMMVILKSTEKKDHSLWLPAIAIGGTVGLEALFAGPVCGASMNPFRSLAPALLSGHFRSLWIYLLAPVTGMLTAVFAYRQTVVVKTGLNNS